MGAVRVQYSKDGLAVALWSDPDVDPERWDETIKEIHRQGYTALQEYDDPYARFSDGSELHLYLHRDLFDLLEEDTDAVLTAFQQLRHLMIPEDA